MTSLSPPRAYPVLGTQFRSGGVLTPGERAGRLSRGAAARECGPERRPRTPLRPLHSFRESAWPGRPLPRAQLVLRPAPSSSSCHSRSRGYGVRRGRVSKSSSLSWPCSWFLFGKSRRFRNVLERELRFT